MLFAHQAMGMVAVVVFGNASAMPNKSWVRAFPEKVKQRSKR